MSRVIQRYPGSALSNIAGAEKYFAPAKPLKGYWINAGSTNHTRTFTSTVNGITYTYTMHPGTIDPIAKTGSCTVDILITPGVNTAYAQWGNGTSSIPTRKQWAAGGGTLTFNGVDIPADNPIGFIWLLTGDTQVFMDRWDFR